MLHLGKLFLSSFMLFMCVTGSVFASEVTPAQMSMYNEIVHKLQAILDTFGAGITNATSGSQLASAVTAGIGVGQRAQLKATLSTYPVRSAASQGSKTIGNQPKSALGTVSYGPTVQTITTYPVGCNTGISTALVGTVCTPTYTYLYWMRVNFDSGVDGWVEQKYLAPAISVQYTIDAPLVSVSNSSIRSTPNGTTLGTQPAGSEGVISGAPASSGGKVWWPVNFKRGVDGWTDAATIKNIGVEIPSRNLSVIEMPATALNDANQLSSYATLAGVTTEQLTSGVDALRNGGYTVVSNGIIKIIEITAKGAGKTGINRGTLILFGEDDIGNVEIALIDPVNGAVSVRENLNDDNTQLWTLQDVPVSGGTTSGKFVIAHLDVGYDQNYITVSELMSDGSLNIMAVSEPIGQIDMSKVTWTMPDVCSGGCIDMTVWGVTGVENADGSVTTESGLGGSTDSSGGEGGGEGGSVVLPPSWDQFCTINECPPPGQGDNESEMWSSVAGYVALASFELFELSGN